MTPLPYSLLLLLLSIPLPSTLAAGLGTVPLNGTCNLANNGLDPDTHRFVSDCNPMGFCGSQGICEPKGCRKDQYAFGYGANPQPPMCPDGTFCPDEEDQCLPLVEVGKPCQLNRDDECAPPPNWKELSSSLNSNGSICLSFTCQYQNATLGSPCIVENVPYTGYGSHGTVFVQIVSRDNCRTPEGYCDGVQRVCMRVKGLGEACAGNKECGSYNCENGACGLPPGTPRHVAIWEYGVTGAGIIILMATTFIVLFVVHGRQRDRRQAEIAAYWEEQTTYRKSLFALHSAHPNLSRPGTMYALGAAGAGGGTSPSVTTFGERETETETDTLNLNRRGEWGGRRSEDSKAELMGVGGSTMNLIPAEESSDGQREGNRRHQWTPLI